LVTIFSGGMALSCLKMADIRNGRSDAPGNLLLGQVKLASARADYTAEPLRAARLFRLIFLTHTLIN
jgi:hypothetical protein